MGKVYKAFDPDLERNVAVKILPSTFGGESSRVTRFVQEARAASALNHPHVVAVYDIGEERLDEETESVRYIAMELIEGKTLRDLISEGLELKKGLKLIMQVSEALAAAHAEGIIHRDLKPENIMTTKAGYAKVLDFGLAKLRARDEVGQGSRTEVRGTEPGTVMGTAGYMSPEQAEGKAVDHRSDIFSLGAVLYELVARQRAFSGDSTVDTLHKIIHTDPEPLRNVRSDTPQELVRIVRKSLAKDRDERYQSVKDVALDLRDLLREIDSNPSGSLVSAGVPAAPSQGRAGLYGSLLAVVLVLGAVAAWLVFRPRTDSASSGRVASAQITRVTATGRVTGASISPDGKYGAYVLSEQGEQSLMVRQLMSGQTLQLIPPRRVGYWGLTFTPDGSSIYYGEKSSELPAGAIYQISTLGGSPRKIIEDMDAQPAFSPDGKQMAFLRLRFPTAEETALIVANADGSGERTLARCRAPERFAPVFFAGVSWSPDGSILAAAVNNADSGVGRIVAVDGKSGAMRPFSTASWRQVAQVAWLPDQKGVVAVADGGTDGRSQIWYVPYPSGEPYAVTNDLFDYRSISVTGDGKSLMTVASDTAADVWIYPDMGTPKRITAAKLEGAFGIATLPDDRIVFTSLETGKVDLWVMNLDGTGRTLLTRDGNQNRFPVATRDGKWIVYVSVTPTGIEVCRMNIDGSDRKVLATTLNAESRVDISPDGKWVIYETVAKGNESSSSRNLPKVGRVSIDGGSPSSIESPGFLSIPVFSPDGSRIAAYMIETGGARRLFVGILPASGGAPLKKLDLAPAFRGSDIQWTMDGTALVVNTAPGDRANLWRVPIDGSRQQKITNFDEHTIFGFKRLRDGKGWVLSRGDLSRDAVLITGFRR